MHTCWTQRGRLFLYEFLNHRENALLYISESTPFPDNTDQSYIEAVTDEVERRVFRRAYNRLEKPHE